MTDKQGGELLPGTFDMLLLKALSLGPMHGWGVAQRIEALSGGVFAIQQGAVYPALQRLKGRGLVAAEWRDSENNRRARYYRLTATGHRALDSETAWWRRAIGGVERVLRATPQEG
jgi:transcriptional regulator